MSTRYRIEVTLPEDDPSEILDWIQEHSGDETASVEDLMTVLSRTTPGTDRDAIWAILQGLDLAHYRVTEVAYGDDMVKVADLDHALAEATCADEAYVYVTFPDGKTTGWIYFVLGNEPFEVVCDHTVNLCDVLDPITEGWDQ